MYGNTEAAAAVCRSALPSANPRQKQAKAGRSRGHAAEMSPARGTAGQTDGMAESMMSSSACRGSGAAVTGRPMTM